MFFCGVPIIIKSYQTLIESLLALNQSVFFCSSFLIITSLLPRSLWKYSIVVSSANKTKFNIVEVFIISSTYKTNNNGPSIEPCGTPQVTFLIHDL